MIRYIFSAFLLTLSVSAADAAMVKQSNSGICHDADSAWFERTKNFVAFDTMSDCLQSGRAYKGYSGSAHDSAKTRPATPVTARPSSYDRTLYDHWIDADGDCQNERHELLQDLSTGPITLTQDGCAVRRGRWNDPYTGQIFFEARDLDIDHMVPLAWAHARGGYAWDAETRRRFANDRINLFAVEASANRQKGAKGPLEWLPPNRAFHCEYVTRFHRIVLTYKLTYGPEESRQMDALRNALCG